MLRYNLGEKSFHSLSKSALEVRRSLQRLPKMVATVEHFAALLQFGKFALCMFQNKRMSYDGSTSSANVIY